MNYDAAEQLNGSGDFYLSRSAIALLASSARLSYLCASFVSLHHEQVPATASAATTTKSAPSSSQTQFLIGMSYFDTRTRTRWSDMGS